MVKDDYIYLMNLLMSVLEFEELQKILYLKIQL